jgi:RNase adaptor protein for sRNA GlmZ degradation
MAIKLVYDKYQNDIGFTYGENETDHNHELITKINGNDIDTNRNLSIFTWGIKKHKSIECDIVFDATLFSTKTNVDVKEFNGLDEIIQTSIINHPMFDLIMEKIITEIETNNPRSIGIYCNYGKHRSVGWAELLKKLYYNNALVKHIGI